MLHPRLASAACALLLAAPAGAGAAPATLAARVDAHVKPFVELKTFHGVVVMARRGRVELLRSYGMANYELGVPNQPRTRFHVASVSKSFTAAAILLLRQDGRLDVTDPVSRFVPDFPNGGRITLHHLLTHTSGIPNINDFDEYERWSRFPHTPAELVARFADRPLEFEPGARHAYSNSNYNLLALVIERASGLAYGEFLEERVFRPLGMAATGHDGDASVIVPDVASGYLPRGAWGLAKAPPIDWSVKTGNGSLYTTAHDLVRWDVALRDGRLLDAESRRLMFTEHVEGVGYGWFVGRRNGRRVVRINGRSPGFTAEVQRYVDDGVMVAVLSNSYAAASQDLITDLAAIFLGGRPSSKPPRLRAATAGELRRLEGRYQFGPDWFVPNGVYTVTSRRDHLELRVGEQRYPLLPMVGGGFYDRMFGGEVRFEEPEGASPGRIVWIMGAREASAKRLP